MRQCSRLLGIAAVTGAVFFALVVIGQTLLRSDRSPSRDFVSEYAIGDTGWVQTLGSSFSAFAEFALAYGLWSVAERSRILHVTAMLIGISGVVDVLSAIFPTDLGDAETTSGQIHNLIGIVGFFAVVAAAVFTSRARRDHESWRTTRRASAVIAALMVVCFFLIAVGESGDWPGVPQRIFILVFLAWYVVLGLQVARESLSAPTGA